MNIQAAEASDFTRDVKHSLRQDQTVSRYDHEICGQRRNLSLRLRRL